MMDKLVEDAKRLKNVKSAGLINVWILAGKVRTGKDKNPVKLTSIGLKNSICLDLAIFDFSLKTSNF